MNQSRRHDDQFQIYKTRCKSLTNNDTAPTQLDTILTVLVLVCKDISHDTLKFSRFSYNQKHCNSAYLHQGTSYQCHDTIPDSSSGLPPLQPSLKMSCKSVRKFLRNDANRQTNNDNYISSLAEVTICSEIMKTEYLQKAFSAQSIHTPRQLHITSIATRQLTASANLHTSYSALSRQHKLPDFPVNCSSNICKQMTAKNKIMLQFQDHMNSTFCNVNSLCAV